MITRILAPIDGSKYTEKVLEYSAYLGKKAGAKITILHVVQVPFSYSAFFSAYAIPVMVKSVYDGLEEAGKALLSQAQNTVGEGIEVETVLEKGDPASRILELAKAGKYDLIIMGTRGLGELKELLLGSVSHKVSHHASSPVLLVR